MKKYKGSGWYNESHRHSLAAKGIKTGRKDILKIPRAIAVTTAGAAGGALVLCPVGILPGAALGAGAFGDSEALERRYERKQSLKEKKNPDYARPTYPQHIINAPLPDTDKDGVPNVVDWDDDNDGVPDWKDDEGAFDIDRYGGQGVFDPFHDSQKDSDLDGVPDTKDLHPQNPFKSGDWSKMSEEAKRKISLGKLSEKTKKQLRKIEKQQEKEKITDFARKVTPREFFIHTFGRDPDHWAERAYFNEWKQRFATGHPENYMGKEVFAIYKRLQQKKMKYPEGWKGKGGTSVKIVPYEPDYVKPEIKGQQLRIRIKTTIKGAKFRTHDVGKKVKLQRVTQYKNGWETQSWRLNLKDYKNIKEVYKDIHSLKGVSMSDKIKATRLAEKHFGLIK